MHSKPSLSPRAWTSTEGGLTALVAAIHFVNMLDFMFVLPLAPDIAAALDISMSRVGIIGGSYTFAAAIGGLIGSTFLDRFERRAALTVAMGGLVAATAAGGLSIGLSSLVAARCAAGAFGGPAAALALAVVGDAVPPERRGKAVGKVMGAFSVATVLGVPAGLELAEHFGWRAAFFVVAGLGLLVTSAALFLMPPMRRHMESARSAASSAGPLPGAAQAARPLLAGVGRLALAMSFVTTLGQFAIIPNLSAYLQHNLGYPRDRLGMVYMVGGAASFLAMRFTGSLVDRYGATRLIVSGTLLHAFVLGVGFIHPTAIVPALGVFVLFILSGSVRMVSISSLATRVPRPEQRAGFMAALTTVQHAGSSFGAMGSAALLAAEPSGRLIGMPAVAGIALSLALVVPFLAARLETSIRTREGLRTAHMALAKPAHSPAPMSAGGSELER